MSRADNGVDDVDDEFTRQAKAAANAAKADADEGAGADRDEAPATKAGKSAKAADKPSKTSSTTETGSKRTRREKKPPKVASGLNPGWWAPMMVGLMVLGLVWLVVFYLSSAKFPIPGISYWNMVIGFVLLMAGFAMTTRWK